MLVKTLTFLELILILFLLLGEVVEKNLFVDDIFELFLVEIVLLELKLDWRDRFSARLLRLEYFIVFQMQFSEERMIQGFNDRDSLLRVEDQHLHKEVDSLSKNSLPSSF